MVVCVTTRESRNKNVAAQTEQDSLYADIGSLNAFVYNTNLIICAERMVLPIKFRKTARGENFRETSKMRDLEAGSVDRNKHGTGTHLSIRFFKTISVLI